MDVPVAANVLGTMGAVCWSIQVDILNPCPLHACKLLRDPSQLIPQIFINYRRHNAIGLQPTMMMLWAWAGVPLGVYNIAEEFNIALRIQPQILTLLSLVTWIQCFYYERVYALLDSSYYMCTALTLIELVGPPLAHSCCARRLHDGCDPGRSRYWR